MKNPITEFNERYKSSLDALLLLNNNGMVVSCNPIFESFFQCNQVDVTQKHIADLWANETAKTSFSELFNEYVQSSKAFQLVYSKGLDAQTKNGSLIQVNFILEEIILQSGSFLLLTVFKRNNSSAELKNFGIAISGLQSRNRDLELKEHQLELAQVVGNMGHWRLEYSTNELIWSKHIYTIFELDPQKFKGTYEAFMEMVHPEDRIIVDAAFNQHITQKAVYDIEHRLLMPDGRVKWVHERCTTTYDLDDNPIESIGTVQDITERKNFETQSMQLISKIREYSYANSHKLRLPVSNILGLGEVLKTIDNREDLENCVNHIVDSTKLLDKELREISNMLSSDKSE